MKLKSLLVATGMVVLSTCALFAGEPKQTEVKAKPTKDIQLYCEVPGVRQEIIDGHGGVFVKCAMVSNGACMYIPCSPTQMINGKWPTNVLQAKPVPPTVHIEEGQDFVAWRTDEGALKVTMLGQYLATYSYIEAEGEEPAAFTVTY